MQSDPICSSAGCTQYKSPEVVTHPMDYFVPDFGVDQDVAYTENNIKMAEIAQGHTMAADFGMDKSTVATPRNYFVPDFGVDEDVMGVQSAIGNAEGSLG